MPYIIVQRGNNKTKLDFAHGLILQADDGAKFKLQAPVRQGGNGVVFRAQRLGPYNRPMGDCAVKLLKQLDETRQDRFSNEIRILKAITHQSIVPCHGSGIVQLGGESIDVPWMAMDLGDKNLREEVDAHGALPLDNLVAVGAQACQALDHLHAKGIIHRDIKPQNFVWRDAETDELMMIDLGIAKYIGEDVSMRPMDQFTATMEFVGPVFFASPELIQYARDKKHRVDHRSDLFQLGKVLWFLATNTISAGIISKAKDHTGGKLWELCTALLQDDPNDRPNSAKHVEGMLRQLLPPDPA